MNTYPDSAAARAALVHHGPAEHLLPIDGRKPIRIIANEAILAGFDEGVFEQAVNTAEMMGVEQVIISPDSHRGFGIPVGCTTVSSDYIYPPVVGPDICCSMSFLQTDLPKDALDDKAARRALINAILQRIPTGVGARRAPKARALDDINLKYRIASMGARYDVLTALGIPVEWGLHLENHSFGNNPTQLHERIVSLVRSSIPALESKMDQLGSLGAGNHFCSCDSVSTSYGSGDVAAHFGLINNAIGFLTHCGSRGFGYQLAANAERTLQSQFARWGMPFPAGDKHMVYAPTDSPEGQDYLMDMALGANFAVVNHLLINTYLLEAIQEIIPGTKGHLVYHISHNIGQEEVLNERRRWVFRKGATRAFPAGHYALRETLYAATGHPILLPGNARDGSYIMVAAQGATKSCFSVNHGGGRTMGRRDAKRRLVQAEVEADLAAHDIVYNGRTYPLDESPGAYKDFDEVTRSVEEAGLATRVAKLTPRFVIKDNDQSAEGSA